MQKLINNRNPHALSRSQNSSIAALIQKTFSPGHVDSRKKRQGGGDFRILSLLLPIWANCARMEHSFVLGIADEQFA
jgi:hypothetical protein